jgi:PKD repeat protein
MGFSCHITIESTFIMGKSIVFLILLIALHIAVPVYTLPVGFVDEGVSNINGPNKGCFVPNPRNNNQPMMIISTTEGIFYAIENPDTSDVRIIIGNMNHLLCTNGPRGVYSIVPHPDFITNRYIFVYYTRIIANCPADAVLGPSNRLSRFTINTTTLQLDLNTEKVLLETPPSPILLHDGGGMFIGHDRLIYLTIGDGGNIRYSQNLRNLYGKLIRLDLNGNVPSSNPFSIASGGKGVPCRNNRGSPPTNASSDSICEEMYAYGFRNPFRLGVDVNSVDKVRFAVGDVGNSLWEEVSYGGTDYKGKNYGWSVYEGPCVLNSVTNCPIHPVGYTEPFYYYIHSPNGGAVTGSVFIPNNLWPSKYKYMFIEYIEGKIVNLIEDPSVECRLCVPPRPAFRNETFHQYTRMVDVFFGPYQNTQAMYYLSRGSGLNVRRIRYIGGTNRPPKAFISLAKKTFLPNEAITFIGSNSTDPEGNALTYLWKLGDGRTSTRPNPIITYSLLGTYTIELSVTDTFGLTSKDFETIVVGTPPSAVLEMPISGSQFIVGQVLVLKGRGKDFRNVPLNSSQLFWEVNLRHANHQHPFMPFQSGNGLNVFPAPPPEDFMAANNSFLQVIFTTVDSNGLTRKIQSNIYPKKIYLDIVTEPSGLNVLVSDFNVVAPATITAWQNQHLKIDVEDQGSYVFNSWNIGGSRQRMYLVPPLNSTNPKIIARFKRLL